MMCGENDTVNIRLHPHHHNRHNRLRMHSGIFFIPPILLIVYFILNEFVRYFRRIKGIPGPTGLPIVGNLHQVW